MGNGYGLKCRSCNYEAHVTLGMGMAYSLEFAKVQLPLEYIKEIEKIESSYTVSEAKFSHSIYVCEKCNGIYNKMHVKLVYDSGKVFKTKYYCENCKHKLKRFKREEEFSHNAITLSCPECGKKDLAINGFTLWD